MKSRSDLDNGHPKVKAEELEIVEIILSQLPAESSDNNDALPIHSNPNSFFAPSAPKPDNLTTLLLEGSNAPPEEFMDVELGATKPTAPDSPRENAPFLVAVIPTEKEVICPSRCQIQ